MNQSAPYRLAPRPAGLTGSAHRPAAWLLGLLGLSLTTGSLSAQEAAAPRAAVGTAVTRPTVGPEPKSAPRSDSWQRLNPAERQALAPLASSWEQLSPTHRKKWLEISRNFASLQAAEQSKMHERMREWATLSPQDRARARLNFGKTSEIARELSPEEKWARWQAYQALTPEQRLKLAEQASRRNLGAAPAAQPVPVQKLAVLPPPATARSTKAAEPPEETSAAQEPSSSQ